MELKKIIEKKRDGKELSKEELRAFVDGVMNKTVEECQIGAMLMAITSQGFSYKEAYDYTMLLAESGEMVEVSEVVEKAVDKHSTGGITDSCTLVVLPVLAKLGYSVAKYSTKNIGASFGTLDRLSVFEGYKPTISIKKFYQVIKKVGISIIGENENIMPADKLIYKYRELTGTVPSIPLIACSIMAKKVVMGAKTVVLDVKCGEGSLLKNTLQAEKLAKMMVEIGKLAGMRITAIISNLNQPLGMTIGPMLEVKEALELLKGDNIDEKSDLYKMCEEMVAHIMVSSGDAKSRDVAKDRFREVVRRGEAFEKLKEMVASHGGKTAKFDDLELLVPKVNSFYIASDKSGFLYDINLKGLYQAVNVIGANANGTINRNVGVELLAREGDKVIKGDKLAKVYYALDDPSFAPSVACIRKCFTVQKKKPEKADIIYKIIS